MSLESAKVFENAPGSPSTPKLGFKLECRWQHMDVHRLWCIALLWVAQTTVPIPCANPSHMQSIVCNKSTSNNMYKKTLMEEQAN
eukprot:5772303-Amphidinium_carterae.1